MKALLGQLDGGFMEIILSPARVYVHKDKEVGKAEGKETCALGVSVPRAS